MTQETKDKICQVCAHSATCGFTTRSLQDKCPTIQQYDDGYDLGYKEAVEKACEWLKNVGETHYIMAYSDSESVDKEELIRWFKNFMKKGDESK